MLYLQIENVQYNISKYDAKVISTPLSAIEGAKTELDTVVLKLNDGSKLSVYAKDNDIQFELGKKVTAYVKRNKDTGREEIVYYREYKNAKSLSVFGSDIITVNSNYVEYELSYGEYSPAAQRRILLFFYFFLSKYLNLHQTIIHLILSLLE